MVFASFSQNLRRGGGFVNISIVLNVDSETLNSSKVISLTLLLSQKLLNQTLEMVHVIFYLYVGLYDFELNYFRIPFIVQWQRSSPIVFNFSSSFKV